ncbi:nuclear pore complex protein Nup88-like [Daphnia pulex]|uniref:nuclear pore complex protein Nup88-like n=1 Tax=Daphnia pulex TaxID=6669 RepID=UPI001EDE7895|nr:nuclear pore complex protein Nup88-like [Daphnia pulex]
MATLSHKYLAGLNNSQFSKLIKEQKSKQTGQIKKVRSLLTTIEHYLFAWDKVDCCLLVKNLLDADSWAEDTKDSGTKSSKDRFLKVTLTDAPVFQVENIQANLDGSLIVLSGPQGVAYVELPSNLPSLEAKQQGPSVKSARSSYIDQKFLLCNSRIRIQEVKFHPGSPTNSHVVVLTSDNCIRIYDAFNSSRPEKTIPVGPKMSQHSLHSSITSSTTFSSCLDEAVSFDFGTPFEDTRVTVVPQKRDGVPIFLFPVYILLTNGDVYTFSCSVQSNSSRAPKISVIGPLLMQPAALDNYGGDACSLLCLPVSPPVLVIANRTGNIHHAILLPRATIEDGDDSDHSPNIADDLESLLSKASLTADVKADSVLHVTETLELDGDILDCSESFSTEDYLDGNESALQLRRDPACSSRYFVVHDYGVHGVVVPLVDTLSELASKPDSDVDQDETQRVMLAETVVEFILCSRMKSSAAAPPQGVVVYPLPPTLIVMLDSADFQVISLSRLLKPAVKAAPTTNTAKVEKEPFDAIIRRQLQRTHSQPKLSLPPGTELPLAEVVKLFSRSVQTLREEYIMKQDAVREALEKKSRLLELHLLQQFDELSLIQQSKGELTTIAHQLAEKYEDSLETQKSLTQRVEKVLYEIQRRSPFMTDAEKKMGQELRSLETKLQALTQSMESLKRREQLYGAKVSQQQDRNTTSGHLSEEQKTSVNEALSLQSEDIRGLLRSLQQVKKKLAV